MLRVERELKDHLASTILHHAMGRDTSLEQVAQGLIQNITRVGVSMTTWAICFSTSPPSQ